ncbi:alpha/beta hydrolase [Nonomuraea sp. NN258]|uniref:alpha/beta fold hydrolase n=1 Tax=Nonomuraea antri TaxID=2730852 RepID=UPI0015698882|nr:alpha/beta hydrolase [Nonomuraea antri]NRQ40540.1 alpha/beta hydrolase [Nonomuraea antri]
MTIWHERAGAGEPVVLLHSSAADSGMWDGQWEALTARFDVIRVDFRGYGHTPYQAEAPYSDAGDVAELLAGLGVGRARLVGSSYGCRVALALAARGLAERLVLLNPGSDLPETPDVIAFSEEEDRLIEAGDLDAAAELNARTWLGPEAGAAAAKRLTEMQRGAFALQMAADPEPEQLTPGYTLADLDVPALVVLGAHDLEFFRLSARHVAAELPQGRLVELDWAGHLPALERPAEITGLLLDYL